MDESWHPYLSMGEDDRTVLFHWPLKNVFIDVQEDGSLFTDVATCSYLQSSDALDQVTFTDPRDPTQQLKMVERVPRITHNNSEHLPPCTYLSSELQTIIQSLMEKSDKEKR